MAGVEGEKEDVAIFLYFGLYSQDIRVLNCSKPRSDVVL